MLGEDKQRVCVATTHIPSSDSQGGLRRLGQVMALLAAARALIEDTWTMPFSKSRLLDISPSIAYDVLFMWKTIDSLCSLLCFSLPVITVVLTGDFNVPLNDFLIEYIRSGKQLNTKTTQNDYTSNALRS